MLYHRISYNRIAPFASTDMHVVLHPGERPEETQANHQRNQRMRPSSPSPSLKIKTRKTWVINPELRNLVRTTKPPRGSTQTDFQQRSHPTMFRELLPPIDIAPRDLRANSARTYFQHSRERVLSRTACCMPGIPTYYV